MGSGKLHAVGVPSLVPGVSRGPGATELWFGDDADGRDQEFEVRILPPSLVRAPRGSNLIGLGAATPEVQSEGSASGLTDLDADAGNAAWKRRVRPRHRAVLERFFASDG